MEALARVRACSMTWELGVAAATEALVRVGAGTFMRATMAARSQLNDLGARRGSNRGLKGGG